MLHGDGAGLHTPEGAERKAYTARTFGAPSVDFVKRMKDRPETAGSIQYNRVLALPGGLPIKAGNDVVGPSAFRVLRAMTTTVRKRELIKLPIS